MTALEYLEETVVSLEKQRDELFEKQKVINEALTYNYNLLQEAKNSRDTYTLSKYLESDIDVEFMLTVPESEGSVNYKARSRMFEKLGLSNGGYYPATMQAPVTLALIKGDREHTDRMLRVVEKLLPFIKPFPTGLKPISLFEHTLSYNYSWSLGVGDGGAVTLFANRVVRRVFSNLKEALYYCEEYHYYKTKDEE